MQSVLFGRIKAVISQHRDETSSRVLGGAPEDFAGYKYLVGYIAGLQMALELAEEVDRQHLGIGKDGSSPNSTSDYR